MSELKQSLIKLWQSACIDTPIRNSCRVEDGQFVLEINGNRAAWVDLISASGVPTTATQEINGESITVKWASHADRIFAAGGALSEHLPNYEPRIAQLHMGRMVQRSIEMRESAVIEAGTGTGKSFAYAAICLAMGLRCVISTSNKALQMQLYRKDVPFLTSTLYPGKKVELVQGKANYACRYKVEDYNAPGFVGIENSELRDWYTTTKTGNTEEIPFAVDWKELSSITADNGCLGKMCMFYDSCHYYGAKERRGDADVLITNHVLLAMHQMYPGAGILPDEAGGKFEGWLEPGSYSVQDKSAKDILKEMVTARVSKLDTLGVPDGSERERIMNIASIAESEACNPDDYGKVARVILNRIDQDMPLGMDSTVAYGFNTTGSKLTDEQLEDGSNPYNTRVNKGLPPTPISNPGDSAIQAAMNPPEGKWLYFVTTNLKTGETKFVETEDEFWKIRDEYKSNNANAN